MIQYEKITLGNGLRLLVHTDPTTPMAVLNTLYDVGARDEDPTKTGLAHLFEHLMFGGSQHVPQFDTPLQMAAGENNAFTTNDLTNYYIQLPAENIETAFWLESDRMLALTLSQAALDVQRKVVCEEFKEHYINKPYGDAWHQLRALSYTTHPYQWMTIGKTLSHVENTTIEDVSQFFKKHYTPSNAIVVVAGNVQLDRVEQLAKKWFEPIAAGQKYQRRLPVEPPQTEARFLELTANVPLTALYKTWHISHRLDKTYYAADLITEVLAGSRSSRLYQSLVKEQKLFSNIECYQFGSIDNGLICIEGKLIKGVAPQAADLAITEQLQKLIEEPLVERELEKLKNKTESVMAFEDMEVMNRATNLAYYELLGDANRINTDFENYNAVTPEAIQSLAGQVFKPSNSSTLYYLNQAPC